MPEPLFALSDTVALALIAVLTTIGNAFALLVKDWIDRARAKSVADQVATTALDQKKTIASTAAAQDQKLAIVANQVDAVHRQANGITEAIGSARLAQGISEGMASGIKLGVEVASAIKQDIKEAKKENGIHG